jgi:single-strand DNA-binding protein
MDNGMTLCGNITADPTLRYTKTGTPVVSFDMAVNRRWKDQATGEDREKTTFCAVQVWRHLAEHCAESLKKGQRIIATGRLEQNTWENDAGVRQSQLRMVADDLGHSLMFGTTDFTRASKANETAVASAPVVEREAPSGEDPGEEPF